MSYTPTAWVNNAPPPLSATNLNKLTDALETLAATYGISESLPTWVDGTAPALTDGDPLNEMERVAAALAVATGISYTRTNWQAGWTPSRNAARFNKLEELVRAVSDYVPTADYYYNWNFAYIADPPWTSIQADETPYAYGPGAPPGTQQSVDGRSVKLVTAPDNVGRALRFELRDADGPWGTSDGMRSQLQMSASQTWNGVPFTVGSVRWFDFELWLPNVSGGEIFDWGRSNWNTWIGLHPAASGIPAWGCFDMGTDGPYNTHPFWMTWKMANGGNLTTNPYPTVSYYPLFQLTNADGTRYAANYNRRLSLRVGAKFNPDSTGWMEAWVDGVNVVPRFSHATMWTGDTSTYFKCGPYKSSSSPFPSGRSVMYFTKIAFGYE